MHVPPQPTDYSRHAKLGRLNQGRSWLLCLLFSLMFVLPAMAVPPTVSSFSPTSGPVGTTVTINGSNLGLATAVEFNGTGASFTRVSAFQVQAIVPTGATTGKIRVYNRDGFGESAANFVLATGISGFSPATGPVGTNVVITGSNFTGTTQVAFNGTNATSFTVNSDTKITAQVPDGATTGTIAVTSPSGTATSASIFRVVPRIDSLDFYSGPAGTSINIFGKSFTGTVIVRFNYVSTTYVVNSDTHITAPVPANATAGPIMITTRNGTGYSTFSFYPTSDTNDGLPEITNVTNGQVGQQITITGKNFGGTFNNAQPTDVTVTFTEFGGGTMQVVPDSTATNISSGVSTAKVTVPHGATHGPVTLTTRLGTASSAGVKDFILTPKVTSYTPGFGGEGDTIIIEGSGLTSDSSAAGTLTQPVVQFYNGKIALEDDVVPDATTPYSKLAVKVAVGTQTGPVVVKTSTVAGGVNSAAGTPIFYAAPVITALTPRTGPAGTRMAITGRNFQKNVTSVKMFPNIGLSFYSIFYGAFDAYGATTTITVIVPNHSAMATGPITVTTPYGVADSPVHYVPSGKLPTITDFDPKVGPAGTEVTITGTNFTPQMTNASVTFNGVASLAGAFTYVSPTQIVVQPPVTVTAGPLRVTNDFGQSAPSDPDYAPDAPTVPTISPTTGPVGSPVSITGAPGHFTNQSIVYFTDVSGNQTIAAPNFEWLASTSIRVTVPTGAQAGPVRVATHAGDNTSILHFVPTGEVPTITGFSPTSGTGGAAGTLVTINGTNFTPQITHTGVSFNGVAAHTGSVTYVSPTELTARPPATVTAGPIRVANAAGSSAPSAQNFVPGIPTISTSLTASIVPTTAPVGALVVVAGTNFSPNSTVLFTAAGGGTIAGDNTRWVSTLALWTYVPSGVGVGPITVSNEAGDSLPSVVHFVPSGMVPTIDSFTPQFGAAGTEVTITGTNFTPQMTNALVTFNGTVSAVGGFIYDSPTQIRVKSPAGAIAGPLRAANAAGASAPSVDSFVPGVPTITTTGISPLTGPVGTLVTITGANFTPGSVVKFTDGVGDQTVVADGFAWATNASIRVRVPAGAETGKITVTNEAGTSLLSTQTFTVQAGAPVITGLSPAYGTANVTTVTITGSGFTGATAVRFNANKTVVSPTIDSDTQITALVPVGTVTGPVTVVTAAGTGISEQYFTVGADQAVSPTITSFTPTTGPVGTTVTVTGTGFTPTSVVKFTGASGTVDGTSITWLSATSIKADVPAGVVTGPIKVVSEVGSSAPSAAYFVPSGAVPTVIGINPISAPFGSVITITGANFAPHSTVQFTASATALAAGTAQSVAAAGNTFVSSTEIKVVVPTGTVIGPIKVNTAVTPSPGTLTLTSALSEQNFYPSGADPVITSFSPTTGPVNTTVAIAGSNFTPNATVKFSSATGINLPAHHFVWVSSASLRVDVPAGAVVGPITVTTDAGTSAPSPASFVPAERVPTVTGIAPFNAPIGTLITITGTNFTPQSTVQFTSSTTVQAGGTAQAVYAAGNEYISPTEIRVHVPAGTLAGPIKVNTPVTPALGTLTLTSALSTQSFIPTGGVPLVTSVTPTAAPIGASITILGANFTPDSAVHFSGTSGINRLATFVAWNNSTSIRVLVPTGAITGPVTVTTPAGTSDPSVFHFTLSALTGVPTIASFTPGGGGGGTRVAITGTNFTPQATVTFNNAAGTDITYVSPTQLQVTAPYNLTTGPIRVTTGAAIAVSTNDFIATAGMPAVNTITPNGASIGDTVTLAGTGFTGASAVRFTGSGGTQNVEASFTVNSATSISATVPAGAITGPITVTNVTGTSQPSAIYFVLEAGVPTITSFSPVSAPIGSILTINGTGFTPQSTVQFSTATVPGGGAAQSIALAGNTFISSTQIKVVIPTIATVGPIKVNNAAGASALSSVDFVPAASTPTITTFTNPVAIGGAMTLSGTNFAGETTVHFTGAGGLQNVPAIVTVNSTTSLGITVPVGATIGPIVVANAAGSVSSGQTYFVPAGEVPTITGFTPQSGPLGTLVVINGTNFTPQSTVQFNNGTHTAQSLSLFGNTFVSSTQIKVLAPTGATIGAIKVNNLAGASALSTELFVPALLPTITTFTPLTASEGATITITGSNFTSVTAVHFSGAGGAQDVAADFTINSATSITATVPAGAQVGPIAVTNATGTVRSGPTLHFVPTGSVATVTGFTPASGPIGTLVTITGTNFTPTSQVKFNNGTGVGQLLSTAGNSYVSPTEIKVIVPTATVTGTITVSVTGTTGVSAPSTGNFTVQPEGP